MKKMCKMHGEKHEKMCKMHGEKHEKMCKMHGEKHEKMCKMHGEKHEKMCKMHGEKHEKTMLCLVSRWVSAKNFNLGASLVEDTHRAPGRCVWSS